MPASDLELQTVNIFSPSSFPCHGLLHFLSAYPYCPAAPEFLWLLFFPPHLTSYHGHPPQQAICFLVASLGIPAGKHKLQPGPVRERTVPPRAQASTRRMVRAFPSRHWITQHAAACCFPAIAKSQFRQRQNKAALDLRNNRLQP